MNFDLMYGYLIDVTWFFLGTWVLLLLAAYAATFVRDSGANKSTHPSKA